MAVRRGRSVLLALCGAVAALSLCVSLSSTFVAPGFYYEKSAKTYIDLKYNNDVGYLPDGTAMNLAGNAKNHPETIAPDPHTPGSPLPRAHFVNSIGYFPDGTAYNLAGNALNHPETIGPDLHTPGSPLPAPLFGFVNAMGYTPDGTSMDLAGNQLNHFTGTLPDGRTMTNGHIA
jgi:hypothetical protein